MADVASGKRIREAWKRIREARKRIDGEVETHKRSVIEQKC